MSEDLLFAEEILLAANVISLANDYEYTWYIQRSDGNITSSKHISYEKSFDGRLEAIALMLKAVEDAGAEAIAYPYLFKKIFIHPVYKMLSTGMDDRDWAEEVGRLPELAELIRPYTGGNTLAFMSEKKAYATAALLEGDAERFASARKGEVSFSFLERRRRRAYRSLV